jgi:hypothetical protein
LVSSIVCDSTSCCSTSVMTLPGGLAVDVCATAHPVVANPINYSKEQRRLGSCCAGRDRGGAGPAARRGVGAAAGIAVLHSRHRRAAAGRSAGQRNPFTGHIGLCATACDRLLTPHGPHASWLLLQSARGLCWCSWTTHSACCSTTEQVNTSQGLVDELRVVRRGGPGSMSSTVALDDSAVLFTKL